MHIKVVALFSLLTLLSNTTLSSAAHEHSSLRLIFNKCSKLIASKGAPIAFRSRLSELEEKLDMLSPTETIDGCIDYEGFPYDFSQKAKALDSLLGEMCDFLKTVEEFPKE